MDANNCIVINSPMGAKGHQLGRLIASCNDVLWYDHKVNGKFPWEPYNESRDGFTRFHFNRRFVNAIGKEICDHTILPVLSRSKLPIKEQQQEIKKWCQRLFPNKFVYPLHDKVQDVRELFKNSREIFIIPDLEFCTERYMKTTLNYYIHPDDKKFTFGDRFNYDKDLIRQHLYEKILDLQNNIKNTTFVVNDVNDMLKETNFISLCDHLELDFNFDNFTAVQRMIN